MTSLRRTWPTILAFAALTPGPVWGDSTSIGGLPLFKDQDSAIVWNLPGSDLAISVPRVVALAKSPDQTRAAIGFTHMGYSATDVDGKAASLTVTLSLLFGTGAGKRLETRTNDLVVTLAAYEHFSLDVVAPSNSAEEARLRSALSMPLELSPVAVTRPLQIKWTDMDGSSLFALLAGDAPFAFVVTGAITLNLTFNTGYSRENACFDQWWGANSARVASSDPAAIALSLLASGCVTQHSPFGSVTVGAGDQSYLRTLSTRLGQLASSGQITKAAYSGALDVTDAATSHSVNVKIRGTFKPGEFLKANPAYVHDLSGSSVGLDGLVRH